MVQASTSASVIALKPIEKPLGKSGVNHLGANHSEPDVWLSNIKLTGFRNYQHAALTLDQAPVVLTGPNGAGKTNLLEAISLLAPGRGLRRAALDELAHQNLKPHQQAGPDESADDPADKQWAISAKLHVSASEHQLGTGTQLEATQNAGTPNTGALAAEAQAHQKRRVVRLDGQPATQSDLSALCAISWLTPQMNGLFIGSPSSRRRFIDRLAIAFDPAHVGRVLRYERAYRERSKLLAGGQNSGPNNGSGGDPIWLASLESILAEMGVAILATRAALIADLNAQSLIGNTGFPTIQLELTGGGAEQLSQMPAVELEDWLCARAAAQRSAGETSMLGPHASDMRATHMETGQLAQRASTGEQKALLISVILAHAKLQARRLSRPPLLILDDVVAHLDGDRRQDLFAACHDLSGQVWYSGTERNDFLPLRQQAQFFEIADGRISVA